MKIFYRYLHKAPALDASFLVALKEIWSEHDIITEYQQAKETDIAIISPQNLYNNLDIINPKVFWCIEPAERYQDLLSKLSKSMKVFTMEDLRMGWHPIYSAPPQTKIYDKIFIGDTTERRHKLIKQYKPNLTLSKFKGWKNQLRTLSKCRILLDFVGEDNYGNHIAWHRWLMCAGAGCVIASESDATPYGIIPGVDYLRLGKDELVYDENMAKRFGEKMRSITQKEICDKLIQAIG